MKEFDLRSAQGMDRPFLQYSAEVSSYSLVSVDTSSHQSKLGRLNFLKLAHLDNLLRQKPYSPTVVFMHHPPIILSNSEPPKHEYENCRMIKNFAEIVDRHPQIIAFLCGHIHRSFSSYINGVPVVVMPPLSKLLYRGTSDYSQVPDIAFCLHSFEENELKSTTVVNVN
jgi:3',5'-cyclic AMP phosphodiesterase CpdA